METMKIKARRHALFAGDFCDITLPDNGLFI